MEQDCPSNNTRSKKKITTHSKQKNQKRRRQILDIDDVDSQGNIKGLIDYSYEDPNESDDYCSGDEMVIKSGKKNQDVTEESRNNMRRMAGKLLLGALLSKSGKRNFGEDETDEESDFSETDDEVDEYTEEEEKYLSKLDAKGRSIIEQHEKSLLEYSKQDEPFRCKILKANIPVSAKSMIIQKLDQLYQMEPTDNEYHKLNRWVEGIMKVPFDKFSEPIVKVTDGLDKVSEFIHRTRECLDAAVFGHEDAKSTILQSVAQMITNPLSKGNIIALQGPMGNGKTTLIKKGVAKAMGRPFAFIALGGATDSCFLEGHDFTFEGSQCGKIISILQECHRMDPIIYFDELDKISDTAKGEEIANLLCHLTDHSQNTEFQDKYFAGVNIDLSKVTFVFSFNDKSRVNPILLDRINVIETKGFSDRDKVQIASKYLIPEVCENIGFSESDIIFSDDILKHIIGQYTEEQGVRGLKRCLHEIVGKVNLLRMVDVEIKKETAKDEILSNASQDKTAESTSTTSSTGDEPGKPAVMKKSKTKETSDDGKNVVSFNLKKLKFPLTVDQTTINTLLKKKEISTSHRMMYT